MAEQVSTDMAPSAATTGNCSWATRARSRSGSTLTGSVPCPFQVKTGTVSGALPGKFRAILWASVSVQVSASATRVSGTV